MRALVTGGTGFIGTNLVKRLLKDGYTVTSIDNYTTGKKENQRESCQYWNYDISTGSNPVLERQYDVIFHLAAIPRIQPSFKRPSDSFKTNVLGTQVVLDRAREDNIPVVYAGSSSTHGDKYSNPYTFTKWQGEELCKMYNKIYDLPVTICRFYNVYGPYQETEGEYCTVIGIFEKQSQGDGPLTITWDGEQRRDFTHVDDIVDGLIRVGNRLSVAHIAGDEFEFGRGKNYSINEIATAFNHPTVHIPKRDGEMRDTLCIDIKAHKLLGWKPTRDVIDYIKTKRVLGR
jgi:UDP-glucose 4-epimerase